MKMPVLVTAALLTSACAQTPPIQTNYYLAKTSLHAKVVRTVACDLQNQPVVASTVSPLEVLHSADLSKPKVFDLHRVDGALASSDLKTDFYADGRLQAVNATTVGQGETIIKAAISLATAALDNPVNRSQIEQKCREFKKAFADKPLTLTYELWDDLDPTKPEVVIPALAESAAYNRTYSLLLGSLCLRKGTHTARKPVAYAARDSDVSLAARQPAVVELAISTGPVGGCGTADLWKGVAQVGQLGQDYVLLIPKAALFGKQVFVVSFNEAGALTSLSYGKEAGAAGMLGALQAGVGAARTTNAEEAASLKSEADVIAAQQRLVACRADPAKCA